MLFSALMDNFSRTGFHADTAAGAFLIVYRSVEVGDCYRTGRAFFLADLTADTAVLAVSLGDFSVVG